MIIGLSSLQIFGTVAPNSGIAFIVCLVNDGTFLFSDFSGSKLDFFWHGRSILWRRLR